MQQPPYPPNTESLPPQDARSRSLRSRVAWLLTSPMALLVGIMICVLTAVIGISATGGVVAGRGERNALATQTTVAEIDVQFQLGMADLERGQYALAAQRFIWIVERDPGYVRLDSRGVFLDGFHRVFRRVTNGRRCLANLGEASQRGPMRTATGQCMSAIGESGHCVTAELGIQPTEGRRSRKNLDQAVGR